MFPVFTLSGISMQHLPQVRLSPVIIIIIKNGKTNEYQGADVKYKTVEDKNVTSSLAQ